MDYNCIEYYQKAYENETDPAKKENTLNLLRSTNARRDFYIGSLRQINHLFQIDPEPNRDFTEAKWEMYKISINFEPRGNLISTSAIITIEFRNCDGCNCIEGYFQSGSIPKC